MANKATSISDWGRRSRSRPLLSRAREWVIERGLLLSAAVSLFTTFGIILVLGFETLLFFQEVPLLQFLTDTQWTPLFTNKHFGILPLVTGTLLVAGGAMLVALPIGLLAAIYLSEYASTQARSILKPVLEILAGIPTVVYGYFALLFVTPLIQKVLPQTEVFNGLSASLVMGVMIIPLVSSLSEDAMNAVPRSLREGAYALGATPMAPPPGSPPPSSLPSPGPLGRR
ncbi:MAG: pstC [Dehalococcoidia bacterium]|nr:pstC [Dehalococcoidia bacterium]